LRIWLKLLGNLLSLKGTLVLSDGNMDWLAEEKQEITTVRKPWKVMIVDDDMEVHKITKLAMRSFEFQGRPLEFISAYSGSEAKLRLNEHSEIAVILLDVVMETDDAGLQLVNYIRDEVGNAITRIILRTGQAGLAPEDSVIKNYDIDGYKAKTEFTQSGLNHVFYVALRSYRDICRINDYKKGLEALLSSILSAHRIQDLESNTHLLLCYLRDVLHAYKAELVISKDNAIAIHMRDKEEKVFDVQNEQQLEDSSKALIDLAFRSKVNCTEGNLTAVYNSCVNHIESVVLVEVDSELDRNSIELIKVFSDHLSILVE
jgi:CheY-like chemotaxis protein